MIDDFKIILNELKNRLLSSRIFVVAVIYILLIVILFFKLFNMQIINGEYYQNNYIQKSEKTVTNTATRGNIYDRNGNLLAYNKLAYAVVVRDNGDYKRSNDRNLMLYRLVKILNERNEEIIGDLQIGVDESDNYYYTSNSENAKYRFLRDIYGLKSVDELKVKDGGELLTKTADDIIREKSKTYGIDKLVDENKKAVKLTNKERLDLVNIRYSMGFTAFHRYDGTKIASAISEETKAQIYENRADLLGVDIEEETLRVYNDSIYFSSIIGYTGKVQESQLEELKLKNPDYNLNDIVGRIGIEEYMESDLQGTKGYKIINVDNVGHILQVKEEKEAVAGNDVYLTIDRKLQIGIYHLLEQQLAGVLTQKLVNNDEPNTPNTDSTDRKIPIKDAYFQLINNNILDMEKFKDEDASDIEKGIQTKFSSYKESIENQISSQLLSVSPSKINELSEEMQAYMIYIYNKLASDDINIIKRDKIDQSSDYYKAWKNDDISLREFLYYGISSEWIDITALETGSAYLSADEAFETLTSFVVNSLQDDKEFDKLLYKYLVKNGVVTGRELCICLYEQGILVRDENIESLLRSNGENYAYTFLIDKISKIEITPAQLALDPSTAGAVITDVKTGEVLALVSYPGYDNNKLSNRMDTEYYRKLLNDQSLPLYNNATQARKAPGSTFKPIAIIAGLEENVVRLDETINCTGEYDIIDPHIKCWIYPSAHGELDAVHALQNSCNYYLSEVGHRLSMNENAEYDASLGIDKITKYASMFGLNAKSGVEILENEPLITTERPEQSSIGQGTNSFANIQLSRYVATIANKGDVFNLSLLDKVTDKEGKIIKDYTPELISHAQIKDSTWNAVHQGMKNVISNGSARRIFKDLGVEVAGKTGTAQESKNRGNHAFFISFAPATVPEIALTVNIPYGYSSSNAANAAKNIYELYFGYKNLDDILGNTAINTANIKIGD